MISSFFLFFIFFLLVSINCVVGSRRSSLSNNNYFPDCISGPLSTYPICDQSLTPQQRAFDLIQRLTLDEKIGMLGTTSSMAPRLGVPKYEWWSEALHGIADSPGVIFDDQGPFSSATSFPAPINIGASFNLSLVHAFATQISDECRAFSNHNGAAGLSYFTPNINIFRDPRWGRGQETPGEDPFLTSEYVYTLIKSLQGGEDPRYLKILATCKHFAAYDLENWGGIDRFHFNAIVTQQDLVETYNPPFRKCIEDAGVASIMCSYNSVNGVPSCANKYLLNDIARNQWQFNGYIVSDCGAVDVIYNSHHYANTTSQAVADAFAAGVDLDCQGDFYRSHTMEALNAKLITEQDIENRLLNPIIYLIRTGYFDDPNIQPYRKYGAEKVNNNYAQQLALDAARQSIILLKNQNNILPLQQSQIKTIALIGPNANNSATLQSNYYGNAPYLITPLMALNSLSGLEILYAQGCDIVCNNSNGFDAAINIAEQADITIFIGGIDTSIEAEALDRYSIDLPGQQLLLIQKLEKISKKMIFISMSGGVLDISYIKNSDFINGILHVGYPGQSGGPAIIDILFGNYSPAGRSVLTWYPSSYINEVSMFNMNMRPGINNPGRTYKFYTGTPIYEFGYGLSYTTFNYQINNLPNTISIESLLSNNNRKNNIINSYTVTVTNTGSVASDDVVLAFLSPSSLLNNNNNNNNNNNKQEKEKSEIGIINPPIKQLIGFRRIHLLPNQSQTINFDMTDQLLSLINNKGEKWLIEGLYKIIIGVGDNAIEKEFNISGKSYKIE